MFFEDQNFAYLEPNYLLFTPSIYSMLKETAC